MDNLSPLLKDHTDDDPSHGGVGDEMVKVVVTEEKEDVKQDFGHQEPPKYENLDDHDDVDSKDKDSGKNGDTRCEGAEKTRRVSFAHSSSVRVDNTEEKEQEIRRMVSEHRSSLIELEPAMRLDFTDDLDDDAELYDDVERESILAEWQKVDAVLRSEIFEVR